MSDLLFDCPPSLSPRLAWIAAHSIIILPPGTAPELSQTMNDWLKKNNVSVSLPYIEHIGGSTSNQKEDDGK